MKTIHFYLDFISPYAWLAFDAMPQALKGISYQVVHKPVVFGAMLKHHGQMGPAEIPAKHREPPCSYQPVTPLIRSHCCAWPPHVTPTGSPTDLSARRYSGMFGAPA